jgi:hypothetical protein
MARLWLRTPANQRVGRPEAAEEAETLARKGCDILDSITPDDCSDPPVFLSTSYATLGDVMMARGKTGSAVEKILLKAFSFTKECRKGEVPRLESSTY